MPKTGLAAENHAVYAMIFLIGVAIGLLMFWVMISGERFYLVVTQKVTTSNAVRPSSEEEDEYPLSVDNATSTLDVAWHEPVPVDMLKTYAKLKTVTDRIFSPNRIEVDLFYAAGWTLTENGLVKGGAYDGHKVLLLERIQPTEIGGDAVSYDRLLLSPDGTELRILPQYAEDLSSPDLPIFISAPNLQIPSLRHPGTVTLANGKKLTFEAEDGLGILFGRTFDSVRQELKPLAVTANGQTVFGHPDGSAYLVAPDGDPVRYVSVIPVGPDPDLQISWMNESTSTRYLPYQLNPCGFHSPVDVIPDSKINFSLLKIGGKTVEGESLYISRDPLNDPMFKEAYEYHDAAIPLAPFEEYAKQNPNAIFFWKDAFGRWIMYRKSELEPEVGACG